MPKFGRKTLAVVLLLVAAGCVFQAVAAGEFPEAQWAYVLIDGVVGLASLLGAGWLLGPRRPHA
jgi:hypothetical protein